MARKPDRRLYLFGQQLVTELIDVLADLSNAKRQLLSAVRQRILLQDGRPTVTEVDKLGRCEESAEPNAQFGDLLVIANAIKAKLCY